MDVANGEEFQNQFSQPNGAYAFYDWDKENILQRAMGFIPQKIALAYFLNIFKHSLF